MEKFQWIVCKSIIPSLKCTPKPCPGWSIKFRFPFPTKKINFPFLFIKEDQTGQMLIRIKTLTFRNLNPVGSEFEKTFSIPFHTPYFGWLVCTQFWGIVPQSSSASTWSLALLASLSRCHSASVPGTQGESWSGERELIWIRSSNIIDLSYCRPIS